MTKVLGILFMMVALYLVMVFSHPNAASLSSHQNLLRNIGTAGILVLGVAPVIISGGIDLSIGSVLGLSAVVFVLLTDYRVSGDVVGAGLPPAAAALVVLLLAPLVGLFHGTLITKFRLQPFLATLGGLFLARGAARWLTKEVTGALRTVGLGQTEYRVESIGFLVNDSFLGVVPWALILLLALAVVLGIFLHATVAGRYLYAIGANEQAARYAGIPTDRYKVVAYMWCSLMAALGGVLYALEVPSVEPANAGSWYELYAITGAVLGGCSLRGGEGMIGGIVLGAATLPLLRAVTFWTDVPEDLEFVFVGSAFLLGTILDQILNRRSAAKV